MTDTLFRQARKMTIYSQEELAEIFHVDARTVRRWDSGEIQTPDDVMGRMAELACNPMLLYRHFKTKYNIPDEMLPEVDAFSLSQAVVTLLNELSRLEQTQIASKLLAMAADGAIDPGEETTFAFIMTQLDSVRQAVELLRYCRKGWSG